MKLNPFQILVLMALGALLNAVGVLLSRGAVAGISTLKAIDQCVDKIAATIDKGEAE